MLNLPASLKCVSLLFVASTLAAGIYVKNQSDHEPLVAARYHLRSHASAASNRTGGFSGRSIQRERNGRSVPAGFDIPDNQLNRNPRSMIAIRPGTRVRS